METRIDVHSAKSRINEITYRNWMEKGLKIHLQMALDFVIREPIHLHQLPDLLRRRNCKFPTQMSIDHSNEKKKI